MNNQILQNFLAAMRGGSNPQALAIQLFESQMGNNPIGQNILSLAKQGNGQQIEQIARNLCKQRGLDFDTEFTNFKKQLGLR